VSDTKRQTQPPAPLLKALRCQEWNTLPEAGGYNDQPANEMLQMEICLNAYRRLSEYKNMSKQGGDAWVKWQLANHEIVDMVFQLAKEDNG
jgi:hypothetical protein